MRTTPTISYLLTPLEEIILHNLIPLLIGRDNISNEERHLLALPTRLGGMDIVYPLQANLNFTQQRLVPK